MASSPASRAFRRVKPVSAWRKLSLVLWPDLAHAVTTYVTSLDVTDVAAALAKRPAETHATWTVAWLKALELVLVEHPRFNVFVRRGGFDTRDDVDLFLRMTLAEKNDTGLEHDSLWGAYLRGVQGDSLDALSARLQAHRTKSRDTANRSPGLQRLVLFLPVWLLRLGVAVVRWTAHWGVELPGVPSILFPSVSISNVGSVKTPPVVGRTTPLVGAPIHFVIGPVVQRDGRSSVELHVGFDHRLFDGPDVAAFFAALEPALRRAVETATPSVDRQP
ncbi:MAG: hypothetical protein JNG84_02165 [Archangium sp.]|nr:hypothetical protein [Archangium sp.]